MSSPPGGGQRPGRPQLIRLALKLPYSDLSLSDKGGGAAELDDSQFALALVLPYGIGPNEPRLLRVDDTGALIFSAALGSQAGVFIADDPGQSNIKARVGADTDAQNSAPGLVAIARIEGFNGATWDRARTGSALVLTAQNGLGSLLTTPPGMWSAVSNPAAGTQASASRAAGGAGVRHICTGILVTFGAVAAPAATALTWALRDGASGAGTILAQGQVAAQGAAFQGQPIYLSDLAIPGSPNTAMTLEFSALLVNLLEGVTLFGFDAS